MRATPVTIACILIVSLVHAVSAEPVLAKEKRVGVADPIAALLAGMTSDEWKQLNTAHGSGNPLNVLPSPNKANYDGANRDPWSTDAAVAGNPPYGVQPGATTDIFSFSAPAIRSSDAKICAIATGGHASGGSGVSAVLCFDAAEAAAKINSGGQGGGWTLAVKPARYLKCSDPKPAWSPQIGGNTGCPPANGNMWYWATTNIDGVQMPISCHTYHSNLAVPGTTKWITGGWGCYSSNASTHLGGVPLFDDGDNTMVFPLYADAHTVDGYSGVSAHTIMGSTDYNDLDGCIWTQAEGQLVKWCNPTEPKPSRTVVADVRTYIASSFRKGLIFAPPWAPSQRWFFQARDDAGGGDCKGAGIQGACFGLWENINGSPSAVIAGYNGPVPFRGSVASRGFCFHKTAGKILASDGGSHIWQINIGPDTANWTVTEFTSRPTGVTPMTTSAGVLAALGCLAPTYQAEILAIAGNVYIHKD